MTEGKGKKRCHLCEIFISDTSFNIQRHEESPRHRDNVKRLSNTREEKVSKNKGKKETTRVLTQIEERASHSYQKDTSTFQKASDSNANSLGAQTSTEGVGDHFTMFGDWEYDTSSSYFYNQTNGCYYDPKSGFFYTDALGRWATLKEVLAAATKLSSGPIQKTPNFATSSLTSKSQPESKTPFQNGQRHKDNVTKRLPNMLEKKVAKGKKRKKTTNVTKRLPNILEKEVAKGKKRKKTTRVLSLAQIEEKERNATSLGAQTSIAGISDLSTMLGDWEHDMSSGYYYNLVNSCFFDPTSGLYYPHDLGKWVTLKEALAATPKLPSKSQTVSTSQPLSSSVHTKKRKRPGSKPKVVSEEEEAALKAREVERKRVEEREKSGKLPIRFTYTRRRKD